MATCNKCGLFPPLVRFHKSRTHVSGLQPTCVGCRKTIRAENREQELATRRRWKQANKERVRAQARKAYKKNREVWNQRSRDWRAKNPKKRRAAVKRWVEANPARVQQINNNRRARLLGAEGSFTAAEWLAKCKRYKHKCAYCRESKPLTKHHVVPLSRNGDNWITNVVPACKNCNSRIGTKIIPPPN